MKRLIAILLLSALLLAGCGSDDPYIPTGDGLTWDEDYTGPAVTQPPQDEEQTLTLIHYPNISMNPYTCTDFTNRALFSLIYQGLFSIDRNYNVEPVLCSHYTMSSSMTTYTFYIDEAASFSDGTRLRPEDVVASLQRAKSGGVYRSRLSKANSISLAEDGGIRIVMNTAYENLPLLLDIPIVKEAEIELDRPLGTGPYVLSSSAMGSQLNRRTNWWCSSDLIVTAPYIRLIDAQSSNHIRDEFQFGELNLVQADPGSDNYADYRCDYELWDSENGIFLFLGFNRNSSAFTSAQFRAAVTYALDRDTLAKEYYRGFARSATLPASPQCPYYNTTLAARYEYDPAKFSAAVADTGMTGRELTLLVNSEDSLRLRVARAIGEMLEAGGLKVKLYAPDGDEYYYALSQGNFDLYLGQTKLSPNMDLSHFFSTSGNLNYGGIADITTYTLCQQALENHGNYYTLHQTIMEEGLLCPVLFRSYAVYATRGLLTTLTPARDNVFYYSIGKSMQEAYIQQTESPAEP